MIQLRRHRVLAGFREFLTTAAVVVALVLAAVVVGLVHIGAVVP